MKELVRFHRKPPPPHLLLAHSAWHIHMHAGMRSHTHTHTHTGRLGACYTHLDRYTVYPSGCKSRTRSFVHNHTSIYLFPTSLGLPLSPPPSVPPLFSPLPWPLTTPYFSPSATQSPPTDLFRISLLSFYKFLLLYHISKTCCFK